MWILKLLSLIVVDIDENYLYLKVRYNSNIKKKTCQLLELLHSLKPFPGRFNFAKKKITNIRFPVGSHKHSRFDRLRCNNFCYKRRIMKIYF